MASSGRNWKRKQPERTASGNGLVPEEWRGSKKAKSASPSRSPPVSSGSTPGEASSNSPSQSYANSRNSSPAPPQPPSNTSLNWTGLTLTSLAIAPQSSSGASNVTPAPIQNSMGAEWTGLEQALRELRIATEIFPSLCSVVNNLTSCLSIFEAAAKNRQDYNELATGLKSTVELLTQHLHAAPPKDIIDTILNISEAIRKEAESINTHQSYAGLHDKGDLVQHYQRIEQQFRIMISELNGDPESVLRNITTNNIRFCGIHQINEPVTEFSANQFDSSVQKELYARPNSLVLCLGLTTPSASQLVAVKGTRAAQGNLQWEEKDWQQYVRNELLIWRLLNPHPNIVSLLGITTLKSTYGGCIEPLAVCHYHEGGTPREFIRGKELNSEDRLKLLIGIVKGVAHIHRQAIVHGDLKGDNVVIEVSEDECVPKVIDFGSSRLGCSSCKYKHDKNQGGTLQWISPEVRQGDSRWTAQSDVWAVGCVALEVQLDTLPYAPRGEELTPMHALWRQRHEPPALRVDFEHLLSWDIVAGEVWKVIEDCWRPKPDERPSAEQLVISLRQVGNRPMISS